MSAVAYAFAPDLVVVAPPGRKLKRELWDEIEFALELEDIGDLTGARAFLNRLEARLGVTDFDRVEASAPRGAVQGPFLPIAGNAERRERLAKAIAAKPVHKPSPAPTNPNEITLDIQRRWDRAERKIKNAKSKQERDEAINAKARIERDWRDRMDAARQVEALAETLRLEKARGATDKDIEVSTKPEHFGRVRIKTRDGLETMRSVMTRNQFAAAERYRTDYELSDPERGLKSAMGESTSAARPENPLRDGEALLKVQRRAARGVTIKYMHLRVLAEVGPMGVTVLQEVVGKARCIEHLTTSGSVKARYAEKLLEALDVIADHLGLQ